MADIGGVTLVFEFNHRTDRREADEKWCASELEKNDAWKASVYSNPKIDEASKKILVDMFGNSRRTVELACEALLK